MSISCFQVQHCKVVLWNKHVLDKPLSTSLCFNFMHFSENNLFLARFPWISANSNKNSRHYNFRTFANISGNFRKFPEILNFRKIYNPSPSDATIVNRIESNLLSAESPSSSEKLQVYHSYYVSAKTSSSLSGSYTSKRSALGSRRLYVAIKSSIYDRQERTPDRDWLAGHMTSHVRPINNVARCSVLELDE